MTVPCLNCAEANVIDYCAALMALAELMVDHVSTQVWTLLFFRSVSWRVCGARWCETEATRSDCCSRPPGYLLHRLAKIYGSQGV